MCQTRGSSVTCMPVKEILNLQCENTLFSSHQIDRCFREQCNSCVGEVTLKSIFFSFTVHHQILNMQCNHTQHTNIQFCGTFRYHEFTAQEENQTILQRSIILFQVYIQTHNFICLTLHKDVEDLGFLNLLLSL